MARKDPITNRQLAGYYRKEVDYFDNGGKSYDLMSTKIEESKFSFYDYYVKHGKLVGLENTGKIKGIGKATLESLERILEKKVGKSKDLGEKISGETVKNKKPGFIMNLGGSWKISYKK